MAINYLSEWKKSPISNACILRVTNRCDQECRHCAFRSSPRCIGQMSAKMCEKINAWVPRRVVLNIMGGEFSILNDYPEMLVELARGRRHIRLVTNGFWAGRSTNKFFDTIKQIKEASCQTIDIAVSTDGWHTRLSDNAVLALRNNNLGVNFIDAGELYPSHIAPVGRAWDNQINPHPNIQPHCEIMCGMIITEDGMICRCPYGYFPWKHFRKTTWHDAQEYIWGWRSKELAKSMNCRLCMGRVEASREIR